MNSLSRSLAARRELGASRPWERTERRFADTTRDCPAHRRLSFVNSFIAVRLEDWVLGRLSRGRMADLFGSALISELVEPHWGPTPSNALTAAACTVLLHIDGGEFPQKALDKLAERFRDSRKHYDMPLYPMLRGLCGIYLELDDVWQAEADLPWSDDYAFVPERVFGGNVKGLMTYLGAANLRGASFEDVEPALLGLIGEYDALNAAGFVFFEHLVLAGIIAGHRIGGVPRAEALDWFGRYLCWAVGLDEDKPALPTADGLS